MSVLSLLVPFQGIGAAFPPNSLRSDCKDSSSPATDVLTPLRCPGGADPFSCRPFSFASIAPSGLALGANKVPTIRPAHFRDLLRSPGLGLARCASLSTADAFRHETSSRYLHWPEPIHSNRTAVCDTQLARPSRDSHRAPLSCSTRRACRQIHPVRHGLCEFLPSRLIQTGSRLSTATGLHPHALPKVSFLVVDLTAAKTVHVPPIRVGKSPPHHPSAWMWHDSSASR